MCFKILTHVSQDGGGGDSVKTFIDNLWDVTTVYAHIYVKIMERLLRDVPLVVELQLILRVMEGKEDFGEW